MNLFSNRIAKIVVFSAFTLLYGLNASAQSWELSGIGVQINGHDLLNPHIGGINAAQFWPMDMNRDGLDDLFVFDRDGGSAMVLIAREKDGCFEFRYDNIFDKYFPEMESWVIVKDFNADGIEDLFTAARFGIPGIQIYRGIDQGEHLEFELIELDQDYFNVLAFRLGNELANIEVQEIDLPGIHDINGDGDLDVLSFPGSGSTLAYFENMQVEENLDEDNIVFELRDDCWGKFRENENNEEVLLGPDPNTCASFSPVPSGRHSGSSLLVWDPNRDELPDLLLGDLGSDRMVYLQNGGTHSNAFMIRQDPHFPAYDNPFELSSFLSAFQWDSDCDDDLDLLVSTSAGSQSQKSDNVLFYENVGSSRDSFEQQGIFRMLDEILDLGFKTAPAICDLNADGYPDLVMGNEKDYVLSDQTFGGLVSFYHNADMQDPKYILAEVDYLEFSLLADEHFAFAPHFADMDGDGDQDLIVGDANGELLYGENTGGAGGQVKIDSIVTKWMNIGVGSYATPTTADINRDGLPDLVVGEWLANNMNNKICGNLNYFQNVGTAQSPHFIADPLLPPNTACLGGVLTVDTAKNYQGFSAPFIHDTGDSLLLITGSFSGNISRYSVGDEGEPYKLTDSKLGDIDIGSKSTPVLYDLDGDEILELVTGNQRGGLSIYQSNIRTDGSQYSSLSTTSPVLESTIRISPNPARAGQDLQLLGNKYDVISFRLTDPSGKVVRSGRINGHEILLSSANLPAGLYLLQLLAPDQLISKKLIIF